MDKIQIRALRTMAIKKNLQIKKVLLNMNKDIEREPEDSSVATL